MVLFSMCSVSESSPPTCHQASQAHSVLQFPVVRPLHSNWGGVTWGMFMVFSP